MSEEVKVNLESELVVTKQSLSDQSKDLENLQQNKLELTSKIVELTSDLEKKNNCLDKKELDLNSKIVELTSDLGKKEEHLNEVMNEKQTLLEKLSEFQIESENLKEKLGESVKQMNIAEEMNSNRLCELN